MVNLGPILDHLPAWLMVLFRLSGIFLLSPVLGSTAIPRMVKVFLVLGLSLCVYPMLLTTAAAASVTSLIDLGVTGGQADGLWSLGAVVATELLVGYAVGYCATLPLVGMQMGGHLIDQQMGISAGGVFNPELDSEAGVTGQLLFMIGLAVFLIVGGHHAVFTTLVGSFESIPLAMVGREGPPIEALLDLVLGLLTVMIELSLRVAAPVLCILFLMRVAMGFIGRTVPQMNILSVGFIFYILAGLTTVIVGIETAVRVYRGSLLETLNQVGGIFTM